MQVVRRRLRRRFCRLFLIFAVHRRRLCHHRRHLRRRFCRLPVVRCHLCCPCCRFCRRSFVAVFVVVGVFAVRPSSLLKSVKRKTQRVRTLVVRNLPTGPQLRSACFQSTNYTYAGPQVRRSAVRILPVPYECSISVIGRFTRFATHRSAPARRPPLRSFCRTSAHPTFPLASLCFPLRSALTCSVSLYLMLLASYLDTSDRGHFEPNVLALKCLNFFP